MIVDRLSRRMCNELGRVRRTRSWRGLESRVRFGRRVWVALGETNRAFFRPGWRTVDMVDADHICDVRDEPLPFGDGSVEAIYASALIEHVDADAGRRVVAEAYRCLVPGGWLRLVTPDLGLLLDRYRAGDWRWFLQANGAFIHRWICEGRIAPESLLMHNLLVGWLASYSGRLDTGGGPICDRETVDGELARRTTYEFRDWCVSLLEPGRVYAHVHVYEFDELSAVFGDAGFVDVRRTDYDRSACREMQSIDRPAHRLYSICVEGRKPARPGGATGGR